MFFVARGNVPDDRLRPFVHMNMLDPDQLGAPALEPSMSLHLSGIGPEQSSGRACAVHTWALAVSALFICWFSSDFRLDLAQCLGGTTRLYGLICVTQHLHC